jgi:hypothetical protein
MTRLHPRFAAILAWLRGADARRAVWHNNVPLLALRGRELTDDDVTLIADELAFSPDPYSEAGIRDAIKAITRMSVNEPDIARVRERLSAAGWRAAAPHAGLEP